MYPGWLFSPHVGKHALWSYTLWKPLPFYLPHPSLELAASGMPSLPIRSMFSSSTVLPGILRSDFLVTFFVYQNSTEMSGFLMTVLPSYLSQLTLSYWVAEISGETEKLKQKLNTTSKSSQLQMIKVSTKGLNYSFVPLVLNTLNIYCSIKFQISDESLHHILPRGFYFIWLHLSSSLVIFSLSTFLFTGWTLAFLHLLIYILPEHLS